MWREQQCAQKGVPTTTLYAYGSITFRSRTRCLAAKANKSQLICIRRLATECNARNRQDEPVAYSDACVHTTHNTTTESGHVSSGCMLIMIRTHRRTHSMELIRREPGRRMVVCGAPRRRQLNEGWKEPVERKEARGEFWLSVRNWIEPLLPLEPAGGNRCCRSYQERSTSGNWKAKPLFN